MVISLFFGFEGASSIGGKVEVVAWSTDGKVEVVRGVSAGSVSVGDLVFGVWLFGA